MIACPEQSRPEEFIAQCNGQEIYTATFNHLAKILGTHAVPERCAKLRTEQIREAHEPSANELGESNPYTEDEFWIIVRGFEHIDIAYSGQSFCVMTILISSLRSIAADGDVISAFQ
jgi:hypothetical protein